MLSRIQWLCLLVVVGFVASGVCSESSAKSTQPPLTGEAVVSIRNIINPKIIGGGVNFAFSDYTYTHLTDGYTWAQQIPLMDDKVEWANFNNLMDFAGFQFVRFEVGVTQWEPVNDNDKPRELNLNDGFAFSPGFSTKHPECKNNTMYMDAMYRILDEWEKRNIYVMLGNWGAGPGTFCPNNENWMLSEEAKLSNGKVKRHRWLGVENIDEYTESLAAIMYHLTNEKHYQCVKGISVYNEPEQLSNYYGTLSGIYNSLGEQLVRLGIRDKVKIIGLDGSVFWNHEGSGDHSVAKLMKLAGQNIDIVSFHDYYSRPEYMKGLNIPLAHGTIRDSMVNSVMLPAIKESKRPFILGEVGTQVCDPGNYLYRLYVAEEAIQLFNNGGKAYGYWVFNNTHKDHPWHMLVMDPDNKRHFIPNKLIYYPMALMMKYIKNGSDIVNSHVTGCVDENNQPRVFLTTAIKGGDITLLLVNDSERPAKLKLDGINSTRKFRTLYVTPDACEKINIGEDVILNGHDTVSLKPLSITVLTTYRYGNETL
ncbi:MAG: hypothetical protein ABFD54_13870 [Armatimonadota bacterium]|nr:hypothetical protein [bacterium]